MASYSTKVPSPFSVDNGYQVAEIQVTYSSKVDLSKCPMVSSSRDSEAVLRDLWTPGTMEMIEEFVILILNRGNKVKAVYRVSKGGIAGTVVDVPIVMAAAVKTLASSIILCHNHPSGNLQPSQADIDLTKKMCSAGKIMGIPVLDHIILAPDRGYYSFADEGMI